MFALLKKKGWATSLSAGESGGSLSSRSIFMIHIELTDAGESLPPFLMFPLHIRLSMIMVITCLPITMMPHPVPMPTPTPTHMLMPMPSPIY